MCLHACRIRLRAFCQRRRYAPSPANKNKEDGQAMVHSTRRLALAGLIPVVGVLSFVAGNQVFSQIYQNGPPWRPATVRPFFAHITKRSYTSLDDTAPRLAPLVYGRRTDRSTVTQIPAQAPDGSVGGWMVLIMDTPHRQNITLEPLTRSKITETYADKEFAFMLSTNLNENCPVAAPTDLPPAEGGGPLNGGAFFGHAAVYSRSVDPIRSGGVLAVERWTVPDLNCFPVKEIATRGGDAQRGTG
jgi:hypothetical protein